MLNLMKINIYFYRLPEIFDMILVFMGKPIWLKNPHMRARLAENLGRLDRLEPR